MLEFRRYGDVDLLIQILGATWPWLVEAYGQNRAEEKLHTMLTGLVDTDDARKVLPGWLTDAECSASPEWLGEEFCDNLASTCQTGSSQEVLYSLLHIVRAGITHHEALAATQNT